MTVPPEISRMASRLLRACLAAGLLTFAVPAWAQEPTPGQLAAARELIAITGALTSVDQLMPGFTEEVRRQTITQPDLTKDLDQVLKQIGPELEAQKQQAYDSVARVYAKYLTEQELRDVIAFFKTPSGSKYIKVQPDLIDEVVDSIQVWAQHTSEYTIARVRTEMAKRGKTMQ